MSFSFNKEFRCPKCYLIPFIYISNKENNLFITIKCTNNHIYTKTFDEMLNLCLISNYSCFSCLNENQINNNYQNILYYCSKCFNFFCLNHGLIHNNLNENHSIFNNNKIDSICFEHNGNSLVGYCLNDNKNYCLKCEHYYENNKKIDDELNDEQIKKYENEMKKNEKIIEEIELIFYNYKKKISEFENNFSLFKENMKKKIEFIKEIINFYKIKKSKFDTNYQMKSNIENNYFDLTNTNQKIKNYLNIHFQQINELILLFKTNEENEIKKELNEIKKESNIKNEKKITNFNYENINNIKTLHIYNKGSIFCIKILEDGRLATGDSNSKLIIYNTDGTFNPDIIIENNLSHLYNFIQLKNKNIICSFYKENTLKIIKINNNFNYEEIQLIKNAHNNLISKILELKNDNLITFSYDYSFIIWNLNKNNKYKIINEYKDSNELSDGLEIKENKIISYALNSNPQSLVFYDLKSDEKIKILSNLNLKISYLCRIIKLNNNEIIIAGFDKIYLINVNNYLILNEIYCENSNCCILKFSNNLFFIGNLKGEIIQYKIENKKIVKKLSKKNSNKCSIYSMTILNDVIISGGFNYDFNN